MRYSIENKCLYLEKLPIVFIAFSNLDHSRDQQINGVIFILTYFSNIISKEYNREEKGYNQV